MGGATRDTLDMESAQVTVLLEQTLLLECFQMTRPFFRGLLIQMDNGLMGYLSCYLVPLTVLWAVALLVKDAMTQPGLSIGRNGARQ